MTRKMLIDATHEEETRVAVVDGRKLVEFDYESKFRKPLKGSIFLAKVTRVEPSLQAAFVNFGGNRHGFLPFAEIHPDYFRIPIADREALLAEQQAMIEEQEAAEREREQREQEEQQQRQQGDRDSSGAVEGTSDPKGDDEDNVEYLEREDETIEEIGGERSLAAAGDEGNNAPERSVQSPGGEGEMENDPDQGSGDMPSFDSADDEGKEIGGEPGQEGAEPSDEEGGEGRRHRHPRRGGRDGGRGRGRGRGRMAHRSGRSEKYAEEYSPEDRFRANLRRKYKIQEVIKRGQIMLVQVSKEERGNKGAAVSTYLSLPGRYCVLMPNSPRAGGVSRKIANYQDRARMKEIMQEINVPQGMSVIVRTAGVSRTKAEIKRDLDYLMRLWDNIRELTLQSSAPSKVYEEADLIKRAVRDLYGKDIEEIVVEGDEGFKTAKNFMKMMMPSHVKNVIEHTEDVPLFTRHHVEEQIVEIGEARVTLPSGGYLIINQTEALVAVDVNSGRATKERHIEETALKTNLEAASEIARQLRLRDLGGLVVIDFIDMEDRRNNGKVERRVREALSTDRARIQMSRISSFGLMELSRQRLNPSLTESQFEVCPHCVGLGRIRTCDATSIMVLRAIEGEGIKSRPGQQIIAHVSNDVAVYILNNKRKNVIQIESRYGINILIRVDETVGAGGFRIESVKGSGVSEDGEERDVPEMRHIEAPMRDDGDEDAASDDAEADSGEGSSGREDRGFDSQDRNSRRRGRRGGRRRGRREFRDRDDRPGSVNENASRPIVSEHGADPMQDDSDEFQDAAAHQAIHDKQIESFDSYDAPKRERQDRGGRFPRGQGRGGSGRDRDRGGRHDNNRPERKRFDENRPRRDDRPARDGNVAVSDRGGDDVQSSPRAERSSPSFEARQKTPIVSAPPAPSAPEVRAPAPPKPYENVNPEPSQKKRGWWNRLTE
ncbi:MAG: Rne/Rng family ribonuclease [Alphaproteobacteria bacterium]